MSKFKTGDRVYDMDYPERPSYKATVLSEEEADGGIRIRFDSGFGSGPEGLEWGVEYLSPLDEPTTYTLVETVPPPETLDVTPQRLAEMLSGSEWVLTNIETGQTFRIIQTR